MSEIEVEIHVCAARYSEENVSTAMCPTCQKETRFLNQFQGYYGWRCTCLECGDTWADGELVERPFARGWRKQRLERALRRAGEVEMK